MRYIASHVKDYRLHNDSRKVFCRSPAFGIRDWGGAACLRGENCSRQIAAPGCYGGCMRYGRARS